MYMFFEITTVAIECLLVHVFFNAWFGTRTQKRSTAVVLMTLYFCCHAISSLLPISPAYRVVLSTIIVFGIVAALYKTTLISSLYSTLLYMALAVLSEYLSGILLSTFNIDTAMFMSESYARVILMVLSKTVQLAAVLVAASILRKNRATLTMRQVLPLLPCLVISIYICMVFFRVCLEHDDNMSLMLSIAVIGLLYINGLVILNTQSIKNATVDAQEQRLALQHYEMQEQYYNSILKDKEDIRALWHDLNKHMIAIKALVESGGNQEAGDEYMHIKETFNNISRIIDVDNPVLNIILYHGIMNAKSENVAVKLDVNVPHELPFSAVDLSVIIGNTFDNAIDECAALSAENPAIDVSLIKKNNMLFYEITNPCVQEKLTTKTRNAKMGSNHGYGLPNVKRCVDKYGGTITNGFTDGQYKVSICLNCE